VYRVVKHRERDERGAVAIIVAVALMALCLVAAMVLDFGLVRIDRQVDRSSADSATLAGLHGLNAGDGLPHPFMGVCTAIRYLKANSGRFAGAPENVGWTDGNGASKGNGCSDAGLRNQVCKPGEKDSWARWTWSGSSGGLDLDVTIQSGYDFAVDQWNEDSLPASSGDNGDVKYQGCDHLAVTVEQSRQPGLGSLATSSDLQTAIRSVGRIKARPGDSAPAMLLLKRSGCPVLKTGSSGGGSFIRVLGAVSSTGLTQPGTIHSDSDGVGCDGTNNGWVYGGLANHGIVAYAAPVATNPTAADPNKPGSISSVAVANGITGTKVRDSLDYAYGSTALNGTSGTKVEVTGRSRVTRRLVDERYFPGVKAAMTGATNVFVSGASGVPSGWTPLVAADQCKPTQAEVNASVATATTNSGGRLYIDCTANSGFAGPGTDLVLNATSVYFRGLVGPGAAVKLPKAHHVYIGNHTGRPEALDISNNRSFELNTDGNMDAATSKCSGGQRASKAVMFVRTGSFKQNGSGSLLRMCRTTVLMMSGQADGCVPTNTGAAPTATPCGTTTGTGRFTQNGGGGTDWTAPDTLDQTTDATTGDPLPGAVAAWGDANGPEDLALWSESGTSSSENFSMSGGSLFHVRGVFMVPNAAPFIISGGSSLNLTNAQYVATSIELDGSGTNITMAVDPNSAVTLPDQDLVGLVR
jgi:hypothetical protein